MSRAEERALEVYPYNRAYTDNDVEYDGNFCNRLPYIEGYEQAEKDIIKRACTWLSSHYDIDLVRFRKEMLAIND